MRKFMFKFQLVIKTSIAENLDYYKKLSINTNKLEDNGFKKSLVLLGNWVN